MYECQVLRFVWIHCRESNLSSAAIVHHDVIKFHNGRYGLNFCGTKLLQMAANPRKPRTFSPVKIKAHMVYMNIVLCRTYVHLHRGVRVCVGASVNSGTVFFQIMSTSATLPQTLAY